MMLPQLLSEHISGSEREFCQIDDKIWQKILVWKILFLRMLQDLPNRAQMTTARDISELSYAMISNFPKQYKLFSTKKFTWKGKTYKSHNIALMRSYPRRRWY